MGEFKLDESKLDKDYLPQKTFAIFNLLKRIIVRLPPLLSKKFEDLWNYNVPPSMTQIYSEPYSYPPPPSMTQIYSEPWSE